ncbi:MAG: P-loop NTPase [Candidatus Hydrothermarchaeales archaeon]
MGINICIASGKDGVGKSQIAANLGAVISNMGINTLIMDCDIKGASLGLIYGVTDQTAPSLQDVLKGRCDAGDAVIESLGINLVIGSLKIQQMMGIPLDTLHEVIGRYTDTYEVVIVDSPGGLGGDALAVIDACSYLLLVLTPDINSIIHGIKTLIVAKKTKTIVLGAVLNRTGSHYDIPVKQASEFLNIAMLGKIPEENLIKRSAREAVPMVLGYPKSKFSKNIRQVSSMILDLLNYTV